MNEAYDIAIVGAGFSGSLLAMIARRLGRSVVLLERGAHPRFAIGESSTPLSNLLLEELVTRYDLPEIGSLCKWGSWQQTHPELVCGLKRGFTFHHHNLDAPLNADNNRRDQLLVAASPHDETGDTHWYRFDFDHFLVKQAQALGVEYVDQVELSSLEESDGWRLKGQRNGSALDFRAKLIVDATGPRGFLHRAMGLTDAGLPCFPNTQSLYNHFNGGGRLGDGDYSRTGAPPPFPIDDAAVHHVFDGGWIWVLQFNNGVTSAGVVAVDRVADQLMLEQGGPAWDRLLARIPGLQEQFKNASHTRPYTYTPSLPFRSNKVAGKNWALLPSAAGFIDPLLSTGFPLTLLGVTRLAEIIANDWGLDSLSESLARYGRVTIDELLATARLIGALYASTKDFPLFSSVVMLYFAAASYSETVRRLNRPQLAGSFLLCDDPVFGPACLQDLRPGYVNRTQKCRGHT